VTRSPRVFALLALLAVRGAGAPPAYPLKGEEARLVELMDRQHKPLEAREAARACLARHPGSFLAWEIMGMVYLHTEGDLPRALHCFQRARALLEEGSPKRWWRESAEGYYEATLGFMAHTQMRMERYEDGLATLRTLEGLFNIDRSAEEAWPLMKLGRFKEAEARIAMALHSDHPGDQVDALNTLAALESESDRPEEAFATQARLLELERARGGRLDCTILRNAGDSAMALAMPARAERFYLEATGHFSPDTVSNPWGDLAALYLLERRLPECLDAAREMQAWAYRSTPLAADTHWNMRQTYVGGLLLACGSTEEALAIARRQADRPDRHAMGSARNGVREAGSQLFLLQALVDAMARNGEELSFAPWKTRPRLLLDRARLAFETLLARRRAATLIMESPERLRHSLRVLAPECVVDVPGGEGLLALVVGPGVAEAEAARLLARPGRDRERGFLSFALGAARMARGDARGALGPLGDALRDLPREYVLMRTQAEALRAGALGRLGDLPGTLRALAAVMTQDGGEVRRQGLRLPCRIQAGPGAAAARAAGMLADSPRLAPGHGGFRVTVGPGPSGGLQGDLEGPQGEVFCRLDVPGAGDAAATARAFCRAFHRRAFGPRIDLSQQQIHSLEGSTLAAQSAQEQLKDLLGGP
jgi:tetratricopeptide (TPR) repeat protein